MDSAAESDIENNSLIPVEPVVVDDIDGTRRVELAEGDVDNHGDGIRPVEVDEKYEEILDSDREPVEVLPERRAVHSSEPSQGEILSNIRAVLQALEAMRNEHVHTRDSLMELTATEINELNGPDFQVTEKLQIVQNTLEQLELGICESQVPVQLAF